MERTEDNDVLSLQRAIRNALRIQAGALDQSDTALLVLITELLRPYTATNRRQWRRRTFPWHLMPDSWGFTDSSEWWLGLWPALLISYENGRLQIQGTKYWFRHPWTYSYSANGKRYQLIDPELTLNPLLTERQNLVVLIDGVLGKPNL